MYARIPTCTRSMPIAAVAYNRSRLRATSFIMQYSIEITVSSSQCDPHLFQNLVTV